MLFFTKPLAEIILKMKERKEPISNTERNNWVRDNKKLRYYFFDYLYYRLYFIYKKHNETPCFSACILLTMIFFVILLFFSIFFNCVLTDQWLSLKNFTASQGQYISLGLGGNVLYHVVFTIYP